MFTTIFINSGSFDYTAGVIGQTDPGRVGVGMLMANRFDIGIKPSARANITPSYTHEATEQTRSTPDYGQYTKIIAKASFN